MNWCARVIAGLFLTVLGCAHSHSPTQDLLTPDYLIEKGSRQITFFGDNEHPRFSLDDTKLLYQSARRSSHKSSQIYEIDLTTSKERRVTFSDGDAFDATYINDNEILYASTTDEVKENPFISPRKEGPLPSDLYMSDHFGNDILRLTRQPGYDGTPLLFQHPTKPYIIFSSRRGELSGIYRLDLVHLPVSLISAEKGKEKNFPALHPLSQKLAWVETNTKTETQSLILYNLKNKSLREVKSGDGVYRDLFFASRPPERLFYSVLRKGDKHYQIEVYNLESNCTQVVFKGADSLLTPTVSHGSPEKVAFARSFQDKKQIYMAPLPSDLGPCLETQPQAKLSP